MTRNHFGGHFSLMGCLVGQHGVTHHVADRKDMRNIGSLGVIDRDKTPLIDPHAGFLCRNRQSIGPSTYRYQHLVE